MISLDEATKDWARDGIWKIAPAGLNWIKEGDRAHIGAWASIGEGARIGDRARIGEGASIGEGARIGAWAHICEGAHIGDRAHIGAWARIGEEARIGAWARIGDRASIGAWAHIGAWASIGDRAIIGEGAHIGEGAEESIDLGWADGYRKCIAQVKGVAYIGAGCRWFTLADALKHWGSKPNRELTMCLMQSAVFIAGYKGWLHGDES